MAIPTLDKILPDPSFFNALSRIGFAFGAAAPYAPATQINQSVNQITQQQILERAAREAERENKKSQKGGNIGKIAGTAASILAAPATGGASLALAPTLASAGEAIGSVATGGTPGAITGPSTASADIFKTIANGGGTGANGNGAQPDSTQGILSEVTKMLKTLLPQQQQTNPAPRAPSGGATSPSGGAGAQESGDDAYVDPNTGEIFLRDEQGNWHRAGVVA